MNKRVGIAIVGAGQAGLAISYYLTQKSRKHIILEQDSAITPAWRSRWDSFTLVLPNWTLSMPGYAYQGDDPDGFLDRDDLVEHMERFAATFEPDIRFGTKVKSLEKNPDGENYLLYTGSSVIEADRVVVAAGTFQEPKIPPFSKNIRGEVAQIHTSDYRNPESLEEGAVLVVGTGQSGCQIAEELCHSGRKVYLCVGGAPRVPRRYRGKDLVHWLSETGFFDQTVDTLPSPKARFGANPFVSGKDGGHSLDLHQFAKDGVVLLGHLTNAQDDRIFLAPDLHENLAKVDKFVGDLKQAIDEHIEKQGITAEAAADEPLITDGYDSSIIEALSLSAEGIRTVIWATGYRYDYSWIKLPLLDQDGYPISDRGVSKFPGLYFLGLHWLHSRKSGLLWGVAEDAAHIAAHLDGRS